MADPTPRLLLEALRPLQRELNARRTLSIGKLGILRHLSVDGPATTGQLATRIRVSPQGISLATRELEELGLIERTQDEADRRKVWFRITEQGRERHDQESFAGQDWLEQAIRDRLTPTEATALTAAIPALLRLTGDTDV
ncbi:DNA-binding MarR family transcriptional regulator [Nocardioides daedukensis]|uniref:DNA-binding MarR family transcriptional regulator n=1 Tax=Nocardioides daedukensis TaxID=634462 RepID=A0A7Y9S0G3_9ACTN|nr:MarR family transcriptional regulator [Nocardioides daedukensis]NYG58876.1 DNA-binding MarR family transcriptional regulator [Nocardioides daedukensis]